MVFLRLLLAASPVFAQTSSSGLEYSAQWSRSAASAGTLSDASVLASRAMEGSLIALPAPIDARGGSSAKTFSFTSAPPKTVESRPAPKPDAKESEPPAEEEPGALKTFRDAFFGLGLTPFMLGMSFGAAGGVLGGTYAGKFGLVAGSILGIIVGLVVGAVMGVWGFLKGLFSGFGKLFRGKL